MLAYKFTEKGPYSRRLSQNQFNFFKNYFHQHLPEEYSGPIQTSKIEKFAIIVDG